MCQCNVSRRVAASGQPGAITVRIISYSRMDRMEAIEKLKATFNDTAANIARRCEAVELEVADLKQQLAFSKETNAELKKNAESMVSAKDCVDQINAVHNEMSEKLSAERKELELTQKLLKQARDERDAARSERDLARSAGQQAINERLVQALGLQNLNRAQGERIAALLPGLQILSGLVKELELKLELAHKQKDELDADYGKLVGEYEDISKHFDLLRNLILDVNLDRGDRYASFGRAMRVDRKEAKEAIHKLVTAHPICVELQQKLNIMITHTETERTLREGEVLLHPLPHKAQMVLDAADNCTRHALSSLQYGHTHHCLARLRDAVLEYQKFLTKSGKRRDEQG